MKQALYKIVSWFCRAPAGLTSSFIACSFFILLIASFTARPALAACTNCTITDDGDNRIVYSFTGDSGTYTPPEGVTIVEYLVVGGGGGGGAWRGGGGGAGGVLQGILSVEPGVPLDVVVGDGGSGAPGGTNNAGGQNGGNSQFKTIIAIGGGGGGIGQNQNNSGGSGGSGGGAGGASETGSQASGSGTVGQGNAGGDSYDDTFNATPRAGGGGGGAGQTGGAASSGQGGDGGDGISVYITGALQIFGGGGGGASNSGGSGSGGIGGGGDGNTTGNGFPGADNTGGGGGGGGGGYQSLNQGGDGGSGIVVIRELLENPPPVQVFYLPLPEDQLRTALRTIESGGAGDAPDWPVWIYAVVTAVSDGTIIYYDQMENGYEAELRNPDSIYHATTNPSGTQIWGDGVTLNGFPPGIPDDLINAGAAIVLTNSIDSGQPTAANPLFNGGDKIAANKAVALTWAGWASQSDTLLAGANEVYDTFSWGTEFRVPVGEDIPGATDFQMFEYTGAAIMAGRAGATVSRNGSQIAVLSEGQSYLINGGLDVGDIITSDNPVQVELLTGDIASSYESRFFRLLPINLWANSYYTPVSTLAGDATTVWLYNPGASQITVTRQWRVSGSIEQDTINVSANSYEKVVLPEGTGARFFTAGEEVFYATSTTDSTDDSSGNQAVDWGFTLVPETSLTPQVLIGLGIGRDPTSGTNPTENGNPVWITVACVDDGLCDADTDVTVYVDYQNGTAANPDPNGYLYNRSFTIKELEQEKLYNPAGNQSGMLIYTLDKGVKLAAAWGQDPQIASAGAPGIDMGTGIPPLPQFLATKKSVLWVDNDNDEFISPGDDLQYEIQITNISRVPLDDVTLADELPTSVDYLADTTTFTDHEDPAVNISDNTAPATIFPLDEGGITLPTTTLPPLETWLVNYEVRIKPFNELPPGTISIANSASVNSQSVDDPIDLEVEQPVYGRIGDYVWWDRDEDGIQDGGEPGFPGATVRLYDGDGDLIEETTTDDDGMYLFTGLLPGDYQLEFSFPDDWDLLISPQNADGQGLRGAVNSDADTASGSTGVFTLAAGEPLIQVAAGLYEEDPTAVVMGNVELGVVKTADFLNGIDAYERDSVGLLAILRAWDPAAADMLANAGSNELLQALNDYLDPDGDGQVVVLRWETLEERGTIGFYAQRLKDGVWTQINHEMLPGLIASPLGAQYWLADPGARPGDNYQYRLIEVEARGTIREYGPIYLVGGGISAP